MFVRRHFFAYGKVGGECGDDECGKSSHRTGRKWMSAIGRTPYSVSHRVTGYKQLFRVNARVEIRDFLIMCFP